MNRIITLVCCAIALLNFIIEPAYAADGYDRESTTINISGKAVARPCTIVLNKTSVNLGDLYAYDFVSADSRSKWQDFTIELKNCPDATSKVKSKFTGASDGIGVFTNIGSARNVAVQIADSNGTVINNNGIVENTVNESERTVKIDLKARVISKSGNAVGGSVLSNIDVSYEWL